MEEYVWKLKRCALFCQLLRDSSALLHASNHRHEPASSTLFRLSSSASLYCRTHVDDNVKDRCANGDGNDNDNDVHTSVSRRP